MNSYWIRQVRILDPLTGCDQIGDVLIQDGHIQAIGKTLETGTEKAEEIDGHGCILGPGLVDLYSQTGEPGHESRETLGALLAAAKKGGFTRVGLLPTTNPVIDTPAQVVSQLNRGMGNQPQVLPWGAITHGSQGNQLTDLIELGQAGIVGFCDAHPLANGLMVQNVLDYTQSLPLPMALWPCDRNQTGTCRDGSDAIRLGLTPLPITAETIPLATLLEQITTSQRPVHLMRISTARSVELIRAAKGRGLPITASVTWLHLLFSTADLSSYNPSLRLAPPLGTPDDQAALIAGLEDGTLDAIAIDHCAYTYEEKAVPFGVAPPGAIGLQLALPMLWKTFVTPQHWSALQLWRYLSLQPAQCLGIPPSTVQPDSPADLVLFDPHQTWIATENSLGCAVTNTVYGHQPIEGTAKQMWVSAPSTR